YQEALSLKSAEQYPKDQMLACDKKLQEQSQNEADVEYQKVLDAANTKFEADDYAGALEQYKKAKDMKPSETFPQKRIDEINKMLADAEAKKALNEKYDAAIRKADD